MPGIHHVSRPTLLQRYGLPVALALTLGFTALGAQSFGTALAAPPVATPSANGGGCSNATTTTTTPGSTPAGNVAIPTEAAAQPEQNPAGDIPDTQAFVSYTSKAGGYSITMPEGWARQEAGTNVTFSDGKLHQFGVEIGCEKSAPTVDSAKSEATGNLNSTIPAFELVKITSIKLPAGPAILIQYRANSAPDAVTGKQHRIDVDRYEIFKDGKLAVISIASPAGSDNVDVSRQVSESFRWLAS